MVRMELLADHPGRTEARSIHGLLWINLLIVWVSRAGHVAAVWLRAIILLAHLIAQDRSQDRATGRSSLAASGLGADVAAESGPSKGAHDLPWAKLGSLGLIAGVDQPVLLVHDLLPLGLGRLILGTSTQEQGEENRE